MVDESGSIVITPKEFYEGVHRDMAEIKEGLWRVEAKLDPLPPQIHELRRRVDELEKWVWRGSGAAAVLGIIGGILVDLLM